MLQLVSIFESDMSSDSGNGCVGTRMWRQQTTRHINVCSHLKCHWWRWNQTRKHLLQSILSGYLNSRAMIFLSHYGPVARTSNLLRLSGRHHVFPTGPAAAVSVLSHIASFWKQSEVGNSKIAISWKRWMFASIWSFGSYDKPSAFGLATVYISWKNSVYIIICMDADDVRSQGIVLKLYVWPCSGKDVIWLSKIS